MGAIMCMGVATSNSILVVSFATEKMQAGSDSVSAALEAGFTRFRPVSDDRSGHDYWHGADGPCLGDGGEQNAPLAGGHRWLGFRHRFDPVLCPGILQRLQVRAGIKPNGILALSKNLCGVPMSQKSEERKQIGGQTLPSNDVERQQRPHDDG